MNNLKFLMPPDIILGAGLKLSMGKQGVSLYDVLLAFNDPEQEYPMWDESGPLAVLKPEKVHIRERTIHGRFVAILCRWNQTADKWELYHSTAWRLTQ